MWRWQNEADELLEYIIPKKKDPLLKIAVGINASRVSLRNDKEIARINSIVKVCKQHVGALAVLHFSFSDSRDFWKDMLAIQRTFPEIDRLQINDWEGINPSDLKKASSLFALDIPLCDKTFSIIHDEKFREVVNANHSTILLDNSKGKGIPESKEKFTSKIEELLKYGLNDIALCGGFGPDELDVYFGLRRHYRINFSIDAETNLKTSGSFDPEKIRLYLSQLLRFDDPKDSGIKQTRKFLKEHARSEWELTKLHGYEFLVHPTSISSGIFPSLFLVNRRAE